MYDFFFDLAGWHSEQQVQIRSSFFEGVCEITLSTLIGGKKLSRN